MSASRLALVLAMAWAGAAHADLFSPGELSQPHAEFTGLSNCTRCHAAGKKLSTQQCLTCHEELQPGLKGSSGLHGRLAADQRACERCHHEHRGAATDLLGWGPPGRKGFDHQRTGWELKGAHQKAECTACHEPRLITWPVATKLLAKRKTMLGVETRCSACHFDEHRGQNLEKDCGKCHDEAKWKPAPRFDHGATRYALKGKHARVACDKCHPTDRDEEKHGFPTPRKETYLKLKDIPFDSCLVCHKDPHTNRFGPNCASCHTVDGWKIIRNASKERSFHDKTRYPLEGAHLDVECVACHGPFPGQPAKFKNLKFEHCTDCHADAHGGQLAHRGPLTPGGGEPDCSVCHSLETFMPPRFGLLAHGRTRFALEGAHRIVPCDECHVPSPALSEQVTPKLMTELRLRHRKELLSAALLVFETPTTGCAACHEDVHDGQLDRPGSCETCHLSTSFHTTRFDHQNDSRYPLTGKHAKVACAKCHFSAPGAPGMPPLVSYRPLDQACAACHEDPHLGQFAPQPGERAACETCHDTGDWKKTLFRHQPPFTTWLLDGKHAQAECKACHDTAQVTRTLKAVRYRPLPRDCKGCHVDFHHGEFQGFEP